MAVDTDFNSVSLLLDCNGADASTTFTDKSPTPKTVTANGNAQIDTTQSKFGGASALFDGTGDYLSIPSHVDFSFGSGDFTLETWVRTSSSSANLIGRRTGVNFGHFSWLINASKSNFRASTSGSAWDIDISSDSTINDSNWHHLAITRSGSTFQMFVDGVLQAATASTASALVSSSDDVYIGANSDGSSSLNGWLDDIRITKGVARYTSDFTPPTISHPITDADSNYDNVVLHLPCNGANTSTFFRDTKGHTVTANGNAQLSTAQSKWGGSSALFDGSGDYLSGSSNDFLLGTGDHTIEFWFRNADPTGTTTGCAVLCMGNATNYWQIILKSTAFRLNLAISGAGADDISINQSLDSNWHHFAWVKSGSTNTFYFDGASIGSWSRADWSFVTLNTLYIGANFNLGTTGLNGNIDDLRITKGVARYTTAFTPPAGPFPTTGVDANFDKVTLLLHGEGTNATTYVEDASPSTKTVTANGNAVISTSQSKWGSSSFAFDGTGDYFSIPFSSDFALEAVDFTVEAWIYRSTTGVHTIAQNRPVSGTNGWGFRVYLGNVLDFYYTGGTQVTGVTPVSTGAWHHVAATRSGTTVRLFLDGALDKTATVSNGTASSSALLIGAFPDGSDCINGYLDDVRITKGVARYTAAFTPPVGAFPDTGILASNFLLPKVSKGVDDIYNYVLPINFLYF